jgi:hypothetical protein
LNQAVSAIQFWLKFKRSEHGTQQQINKGLNERGKRAMQWVKAFEKITEKQTVHVEDDVSDESFA